jgi:hypothetical protein
MESQDTLNGQSEKIFSRENIRDLLIVSVGLSAVILLYHLVLGSLTPAPVQPPSSGGDQRPPSDIQPPQGPNEIAQMFSFWPIWGVLAIPSLIQVIIAVGIFLVFGVLIYRYYESVSRLFPAILLIGFFSVFLTNLIQGWELGIVNSIGGANEIYQDAIGISSALDFISYYATIQPTLTTHALTQPPGAVLSIYFLNIIFGNEAGVAVGLALLSTIVSLAALRPIFRRFFSEKTTSLGLLLYSFLPAVQVYYLANIYAIVATLAIVCLYFYLHSDSRISMIGSIVFSFLGTFISFLFVVIPLTFLLNDILRSFMEERESDEGRISFLMKNLLKPVSIILSVVFLYGILYLSIGFNYVDAFLYASASENPTGFMLLANPVEYFITRLQDVMDILVFLGPILVAFSYRGLQLLRRSQSEDQKKMLILVFSAFLALFLLFLTGAPKKGETARICMFILPFVLIPVLYFVEEKQYPKSELVVLLLIVFAQAVILQLIGTYVW